MALSGLVIQNGKAMVLGISILPAEGLDFFLTCEFRPAAAKSCHSRAAQAVWIWTTHSASCSGTFTSREGLNTLVLLPF